MRLLSLLCACAWRDVSDRVALRSTGVIALTIALVCALTIALFGFVYGFERVRYARLKEDPLSLCLWVGSTFEERLTPQVLNELNEQVRDRVGPEKFEGVYEFYQTELRLRDPKGDVRSLYGRTFVLEKDDKGVERRDPLFRSRPLRAGGREFATPDDEGIVLTPQGLEELGLGPNDNPKEVMMVVSRDVRVPVLGVLTKNLPTPHSFLILPRFERRLASSNPDPSLKMVITKPLPPKWPQLDVGLPKKDRPKDLEAKYPAEVVKLLRSKDWKQFDPVQEERFGKPVWVIKSKVLENDPDTPLPTLITWNERLRIVAREMEAAGYPSEEPFRVDESTLPIEEAHPRKTFHLAAVYVSDLGSLVKAANGCESVRAGDQNLRVNRNVVEQITNIGRQTEQALGVLALIELVVVVIAVANLGVLQKLRAEQKTAEVGMLKAMGMTGRALMLLSVIEGLMLWLPAVLLGVGVGLLLQYLACNWWYSDRPAEVAIGFYWSVGLTSAILAGSLAVSLAGGLLASHRSRGASPCESLSGSG